jgi:hypothetical protein
MLHEVRVVFTDEQVERFFRSRGFAVARRPVWRRDGRREVETLESHVLNPHTLEWELTGAVFSRVMERRQEELFLGCYSRLDLITILK